MLKYPKNSISLKVDFIAKIALIFNEKLNNNRRQLTANG